jgi:hypothetical protein
MQELKDRVRFMVEHGGHYPYPTCRPRRVRWLTLATLAIALTALALHLR